uniref:Uncharacterized protein n=1 Tax=Nymphaea colorata TaxID=210225 RepID=A0A5K1CAG3_9MAGN
MLQPPTLPYEEVVSLLQRFDSRLKSPTPPIMTMTHQQSRQGDGRGRSYRGRGRSYRGRGHYQNHTHENSSSNSNEKKSKNPTVCQICGKKYYSAIKFFERFNHSYQAEDAQQALAAITIDDANYSEWLVDTGPSTHMTGNPGKISKISPYHGIDHVVVGNGTSLSIFPLNYVVFLRCIRT